MGVFSPRTKSQKFGIIPSLLDFKKRLKKQSNLLFFLFEKCPLLMFNETRYSEKKNINPKGADNVALGDLIFLLIVVVIGLWKLANIVSIWLVWKLIANYSYSFFKIMTGG